MALIRNADWKTLVILGSSAAVASGIAYVGTTINRAANISKGGSTYLKRVYANVAGAVAIAAGTAWSTKTLMSIYNIRPGRYIIGWIAVSISMPTFAFATYVCNKRHTRTKRTLWSLTCVSSGLTVAPVLLLHPYIKQAAYITAGLTGALSVVTMMSNNTAFLNLGAPLSMGFATLLVTGIMRLTSPKGSATRHVLSHVYLYGGLGLFALDLMYSTKRQVRLADKSPQDAEYHQN